MLKVALWKAWQSVWLHIALGKRAACKWGLVLVTRSVVAGEVPTLPRKNQIQWGHERNPVQRCPQVARVLVVWRPRHRHLIVQSISSSIHAKGPIEAATAFKWAWGVAIQASEWKRMLEVFVTRPFLQTESHFLFTWRMGLHHSNALEPRVSRTRTVQKPAFILTRDLQVWSLPTPIRSKFWGCIEGQVRLKQIVGVQLWNGESEVFRPRTDNTCIGHSLPCTLKCGWQSKVSSNRSEYYTQTPVQSRVTFDGYAPFKLWHKKLCALRDSLTIFTRTDRIISFFPTGKFSTKQYFSLRTNYKL